MTTLRICLAGQMQAWGASSRFSQRLTGDRPTKSGVLGLLAAAQGRRRTDPIEDLAGLEFGVRIDQPGRLMRDFQVALTLDKQTSMPLSYRYYLSDAVFVAAVGGEETLITALADAIRMPAFPLYLGRRSCPPARPVYMDTTDELVGEALRTAEWQASRWYRKQQSKLVNLRITRDAQLGSVMSDSVRDVPVSFSPEHRMYEWRDIVEESFVIENPDGKSEPDFHDPMSAIGG